MPIDDPAMLDALAKYNRRGPSSRGTRTADIAVTIVLLMVHAFLWGATVALRRRVAFFVPVIGCAAQLALAIGAAAMESLAGPVS